MKNNRALLIALSIFLLAGLKPTNPLVISDGFAGDDAYRVTATGLYGFNPELKSKERACRSAMLTAQAALLEQLADAGLSNVRGSVNCTGSRARMMKSIRGFIRGVTVISEAYDENRGACTLTAELREQGLKRKVIEAAKKAGRSCK